jgi:hypothetical protein
MARQEGHGRLDQQFLLSGQCPGWLVQLRLNSATCLDLALCNTVMTNDVIDGGDGQAGPFTDSLDPLRELVGE